MRPITIISLFSCLLATLSVNGENDLCQNSLTTPPEENARPPLVQARTYAMNHWIPNLSLPLTQGIDYVIRVDLPTSKKNKPSHSKDLASWVLIVHGDCSVVASPPARTLKFESGTGMPSSLILQTLPGDDDTLRNAFIEFTFRGNQEGEYKLELLPLEGLQSGKRDLNFLTTIIHIKL